MLSASLALCEGIHSLPVDPYHKWPVMQKLIATFVVSLKKLLNKLSDNLTHQKAHIDALMQERRNSIANALELRLSCTYPSIWYHCNMTVIIYLICRWSVNNSATENLPYASPAGGSMAITPLRAESAEMLESWLSFNWGLQHWVLVTIHQQPARKLTGLACK